MVHAYNLSSSAVRLTAPRRLHQRDSNPYWVQPLFWANPYWGPGVYLRGDPKTLIWYKDKENAASSLAASRGQAAELGLDNQGLSLAPLLSGEGRLTIPNNTGALSTAETPAANEPHHPSRSKSHRDEEQ